MTRRERKAYQRIQARKLEKRKRREAYTQFLVGRDNKGELDEARPDRPEQKSS